MTKIQVICDYCGEVKPETGNGWYVVCEAEANISVHSHVEGAADAVDKDACSDSCVTKAVSQWLSAQKESAGG